MNAARWSCAGVLALGAVAASAQALPGMSPVVNAKNLYSEQAAGKVVAQIAGDLPRIYAPTCAAAMCMSSTRRR